MSNIQLPNFSTLSSLNTFDDSEDDMDQNFDNNSNSGDNNSQEETKTTTTTKQQSKYDVLVDSLIEEGKNYYMGYSKLKIAQKKSRSMKIAIKLLAGCINNKEFKQNRMEYLQKKCGRVRAHAVLYWKAEHEMPCSTCKH